MYDLVRKPLNLRVKILQKFSHRLATTYPRFDVLTQPQSGVLPCPLKVGNEYLHLIPEHQARSATLKCLQMWKESVYATSEGCGILNKRRHYIQGSKWMRK